MQTAEKFHLDSQEIRVHESLLVLSMSLRVSVTLLPGTAVEVPPIRSNHSERSRLALKRRDKCRVLETPPVRSE
jgi:hypothetical protein